MTSGQNYATTSVTDIADKRPLSQPSTPQRDGVLRGGVKQRAYGSPFVEFVSRTICDLLPLLQEFPTDPSESTSIAQTASSSVGQYLGQEKSTIQV